MTTFPIKKNLIIFYITRVIGLIMGPTSTKMPVKIEKLVGTKEPASTKGLASTKELIIIYYNNQH